MIQPMYGRRRASCRTSRGTRAREASYGSSPSDLETDVTWTHTLTAAAPALALFVTAAQEPVPPAVLYPQHVFAGGSPPPAGRLVNPSSGDARSAAEGEKLFGAFNCDGCHSPGAVGAIGPSLADGRWRYGGA